VALRPIYGICALTFDLPVQFVLAQRDEEVRLLTAWLLDPGFSGAYRRQTHSTGLT
jgi:hypothetical protein